jgi:hypothetical protein
LKIEKVKILEIDDSLKLLQPSRAIEIKTNKGTAESPNRCATSYEYNRKAELPTETTIDNPVSVYTKKFTGNEVKNLLTTNTEYGKQLQAIERVDRVTEYSILHLSTFQLYETSKEGKAPLELLSEGDNLNRFLKFLIDMQYEAKHDIISIPALNLPLSKLKTTLKDAYDAIEHLGKQPIFSFDLKYNNFREILDYVTNELHADLINLVYRKKRDVPQHYDALGKFARKDIAFLMTDVNRIDFDHDELSTMHYMPFLGNDLFAIEIPPPAIPKKDKPKKDRNIINLKILDKNELTIKPLINSGISREEILQQLGNPSYDDLDIRLQSLEEAKTDNDKYKILNALTKIQELRVSTNEFSVLGKHVKERSSKDYVKTKSKFGDRLSKI